VQASRSGFELELSLDFLDGLITGDATNKVVLNGACLEFCLSHSGMHNQKSANPNQEARSQSGHKQGQEDQFLIHPLMQKTLG
jgi:hypothetical protein